MVLGLTLLGLSFVPGVASGLSSAFTGVTGNAALGARLASFGTHLLGQTGQYLMAQGALSSVSPQPHHHAGTLSSDLVAAPATSREVMPFRSFTGRCAYMIPSSLKQD